MAGMSVIWNVLGWGLAGLTVATLLLALLGDALRRRFRRMRRCPKCWYDLSHTPGMRCSECGYTARRERQLFRTRRRKRWVLAALLVWIGSYSAFRTPAIQQRGWVAAVPTTALVFLWPRERVHYFYNLLVAYPDLAQRFGRALHEAPFTNEMLQRIDRKELNGLHWRMLVEIAVRTGNRSAPLRIDDVEHRPLQMGMLSLAKQAGRLNDPALLRRALTTGSLRMATRTRWPVGEPMHAAVWRDSPASFVSPGEFHSDLSLTARPLTPGLRPLARDDIGLSSTVSRMDQRGDVRTEWFFSGQCARWEDYCTDLGTPAGESRFIRYVVSVERQLTESQAQILGTDVLKADVVMTFDYRIGGTINDILSPVESPEFDAAMHERLRAVLHDDHIDLNLDNLGEVLEHLGGATFAVTLELLLDDEVMARGAAWWCVAPGPIATNGRPAPMGVPRSDFAPLDLVAPYRLDPKETRYRLRLTPNPRMALRRFESDTYWSGVIEVPVAAQRDGYRP